MCRKYRVGYRAGVTQSYKVIVLHGFSKRRRRMRTGGELETQYYREVVAECQDDVLTRLSMSLKETYFEMGPSMVLKVKGYFELDVAAYVDGPETA